MLRSGLPEREYDRGKTLDGFDRGPAGNRRNPKLLSKILIKPP